MAIPQKQIYTEIDYYTLPEDVRAELIDGQIYYQAAPSRIHQKILGKIHQKIANYIDLKAGLCEVYPSPFAVKLWEERTTIVEPDISVICDPNKLTERGCTGAPDWIIEIISPGNSSHDYVRKLNLYAGAGVREYWIVDHAKERTTVYRYEEDAAPIIIPFSMPIAIGIYQNLSITIAELLE